MTNEYTQQAAAHTDEIIAERRHMDQLDAEAMMTTVNCVRTVAEAISDESGEATVETLLDPLTLSSAHPLENIERGDASVTPETLAAGVYANLHGYPDDVFPRFTAGDITRDEFFVVYEYAVDFAETA